MNERRVARAAAKPSRVRNRIILAICVLAILVGLGGLVGGLVARGVIRGKLELVAKEAGLQFELADISVSMLGHVHMHGLAFKRQDGSSILAVQDADAALSPWKVLMGRRRPDRAEVKVFRLEVVVQDGKPKELLDLYKAGRKVFPKHKGPEEEETKSVSTASYLVEQGTVQVRVLGKGSQYLPQGLQIQDISAHLDPAHGVGDLAAVLGGTVASKLSAALVPQKEGPPKLVGHLEPEFRLNMPQGQALPLGIDSIAVTGFAHDATDGASIEDILLRKGEDILVSVHHVRPARGGPIGISAEDIAFVLPESLLQHAEPLPVEKPKKNKDKPKPGAPSQPAPPQLPIKADKAPVPAAAEKTDKPEKPVNSGHFVTPTPMPDRMGVAPPVAPVEKAIPQAIQPAAATEPTAIEPTAARGQRALKGHAERLTLGLDGLEGSEIPLVARLENLVVHLPGDVAVLGVKAVELHTDRLPGENPLEALTSLRIEAPSADLPWRQDAMQEIPGGKLLWGAITAAEQAKLRAQVEDEVEEQIDDPNLPPDVRHKQVQAKVNEKLKAAGALSKEDDKLTAAKANKGKPATQEDKKQPGAANASHVTTYIKPLRDMQLKLLEVDEKMHKALDKMAKAPRLKVEVIGGHLGLIKPGSDKPFGGMQDLTANWSAVAADGTRGLKVSAKPFDDERTWGDIEMDVLTQAGGQLDRAKLKLAGGQFAQALRVVSSGVTVGTGSDIAVQLEIKTGQAIANKLDVRGDFTVKDIGFDWWRLAPRPIEHLNMSGKIECFVSDNDGSMQLNFPGLKVGEANLDLLLEATNLRDKPTVHVRAEMPRQDCAKVAKAMPPGLITTIGTIDAKGEISWLIDLAVPLQNVYKATLDLAMDDSTCEVSGFGNVHLDELLGEFSRPVNENGEMLDGHDKEHPQVMVGPASGSWANLTDLPPWVPWSMIATEDGAFYKHRGLRPGLLLRAVRLDLDYGRFVYGGSTITQQLVKNIFLTRAKNLSRKFEELLIVWQMERTVPKDRILELYMNMIEFGPKTYGVQRAAQLYFGKDAKALSPLETAFLAANKPCPRCGFARFDKKKWDSWWQERMVGIMNKMRDEGIITHEQYLAEAPYIPHFLGWPSSIAAPAPGADSPAPGGDEE